MAISRSRYGGARLPLVAVVPFFMFSWNWPKTVFTQVNAEPLSKRKTEAEDDARVAQLGDHLATSTRLKTRTVSDENCRRFRRFKFIKVRLFRRSFGIRLFVELGFRALIGKASRLGLRISGVEMLSVGCSHRLR